MVIETFGPTSTQTSTDSNGNYSVQVAPGTYAMSASATGYTAQDQTGVSVTANHATNVDFELSLQGTSATSSSGTASTASSSSSGQVATTTSSGTTGTNGSNELTGPLAFTVLTALEFPAIADGGTADFSDVSVGLYDAVFTCQELLSEGGLPLTVHQIVYMEAKNSLGISLFGGAYTIPSGDFTVDQDSLMYRQFFPDAGYEEVDANSGTINYTAPVDNAGLSGSFTAVMSNASNLVGQFQAQYCGP